MLNSLWTFKINNQIFIKIQIKPRLKGRRKKLMMRLICKITKKIKYKKIRSFK